jgi:hypothetical protein
MEIEIAALSEILRDGMAVLMKSGHSITRHEPTMSTRRNVRAVTAKSCGHR